MLKVAHFPGLCCTNTITVYLHIHCVILVLCIVNDLNTCIDRWFISSCVESVSDVSPLPSQHKQHSGRWWARHVLHVLHVGAPEKRRKTSASDWRQRRTRPAQTGKPAHQPDPSPQSRNVQQQQQQPAQ